MVEMYAFIIVFTAQIAILSVVAPLRLTGFLGGQIERFITERAPPIDPAAAVLLHRRLRLARWLGAGMALIGLLLLGALIRYMLRPDWHDGPFEAVVPAYFALQMVPLMLAMMTAGRFHAVLKRAMPAQKRKALLQPRGLFDFVSRSAVALALLVYVLFIAFVLYIDRHPFPGFAGPLPNIAGMTLLYAMMAFAIYMTLRTMSASPLQSRDERLRSASLAVRTCVHFCIAMPAFLALNFTLVLLDLQRWEPFFLCLSLIVWALLSVVSSWEQLRIPQTDGAAPALTS